MIGQFSSKSSANPPSQDWRADRYATNAGFVPELGRPALDMLDPQPGERILDLGCGDGVLTAELAQRGCLVIGVDAGPDMIRSARARGVDARLMDGHDLGFSAEFDAVFSNAALHWMKRDPSAVVTGVARALRPGGRFVAEMGGAGNVAAITVALLAVLARRGIDGVPAIPWYFPTPEAYARLLTQHGFRIESMVLLPRPTPLPTSMEAWLETFAEPLLHLLEPADRPAAQAETAALLRPVLCHEDDRWVADYVRLRFKAVLA